LAKLPVEIAKKTTYNLTHRKKTKHERREYLVLLMS